jgi:hypothetical protein
MRTRHALCAAALAALAVAGCSSSSSSSGSSLAIPAATSGPETISITSTSLNGNGNFQAVKVVLSGVLNATGTGYDTGNRVQLPVSLPDGGFVIMHAAGPQNPTSVNRTACTAVINAAGLPWSIVSGSGTGVYKGISGSGTFSQGIAFKVAKVNGKCNLSSNSTQPTGGSLTVHATGTLTLK